MANAIPKARRYASLMLAAAVSCCTLALAPAAHAQTAAKPNILVIFGDDVGQPTSALMATVWSGTEPPTSTALPKKA